MPGHWIRPFGYIEPEPVVRQIGDRVLYLGNKHAATARGQDFDALGVEVETY